MLLSPIRLAEADRRTKEERVADIKQRVLSVARFDLPKAGATYLDWMKRTPGYDATVDYEAEVSPEDADFPSLEAMQKEGHKMTARQYEDFKTYTKTLTFRKHTLNTEEEANMHGYCRPMHMLLLPIVHMFTGKAEEEEEEEAEEDEEEEEKDKEEVEKGEEEQHV